MADPQKDKKDTQAKREIPFASTIESLKAQFDHLTEGKKWEQICSLW